MILTKNFKEYEKVKILCKKINFEAEKGKQYNFMEICGTHTMSIAKYGIKSLLPSNISLISGPGCPVCVTSQAEINCIFDLLEKEKIILCVFGDLLKVPGSNEQNLLDYKAKGFDIRVITSPLDCLEICKNTNLEVVFVAIGFETTIPAIASLVKIASEKNIGNFSLLTFLKTMPRVIDLILADLNLNIDGFLCPGHVTAITGISLYEPIIKKQKAAVVTGFEPVDILFSIYKMILQVNNQNFKIENLYSRTVKDNGNPLAIKFINDVFEEFDADWRGIGKIEKSGLKLKHDFKKFDAFQKFAIMLKEPEINNDCICGDILKGKALPNQCILFNNVCSPENPIGPCMVSSEGACSAFYKYGVFA
jgi:hydrogenase expression/formation protein HypD